jgi:predicted glycosyltransferase
MNILIDIGHPAHVHYYRNLANELIDRGHKVVFTVKEMEVAKRLLTSYGFSYITLPSKKDGLWGKAIRQLQYNRMLWQICRREKIDIAIGTSVSVAHVSKISSVKSVVFDDDDDEVQPLVTKYVNPFADTLLSPEALKGKRKRKDTVYYPGYHELAYLHPKSFQPDTAVLKEAGIKEGETFFIMRFNVFKAHHDVGISGLSLQHKLQLIEELKPHGKIFITTEREIEPELREFQLKVSPEKIHSLMAHATLFLGDSQTMTSEAAVLGIPSLRCNSFAGRISYLEEQEHTYGLTYGFLPSDFEKMLAKLRELLATPNLREKWQEKRHKMLAEKMDVTAFWVWFIENYPGSVAEVKNNTDLFQNFK